MNVKLKFEEEATDIFCFPGEKKKVQSQRDLKDNALQSSRISDREAKA